MLHALYIAALPCKCCVLQSYSTYIYYSCPSPTIRYHLSLPSPTLPPSPTTIPPLLPRMVSSCLNSPTERCECLGPYLQWRPQDCAGVGGRGESEGECTLIDHSGDCACHWRYECAIWGVWINAVFQAFNYMAWNVSMVYDELAEWESSFRTEHAVCQLLTGSSWQRRSCWSVLQLSFINNCVLLRKFNWYQWFINATMVIIYILYLRYYLPLAIS